MTRGPVAAIPMACALLALGAACSRPAPLKVGFVTGLTGRHYDLGLSTRGGVQLAIAEINAAGGVNGRPIELIVRDDGQDPAQAVRAVEELIGAGVVAIIGHATSAMAAATLPIVDRAQIVMISPTVSSADFTGKDDWFFMMHTSTDVAARVLAEHALRTGTARRVAVVYDTSNLAYTGSFFEHFRAAMVAGGGGARPVTFTSGSVASWSGLVRDALAQGSDGVLIVANGLDSATLCQQVRLSSRTIPILGAEWGFTGDIVVHGGRAVEGAQFVQKVDTSDASPRFSRFQEAYLARTGRPADFASVLGYETALVLGQALRRDATRAGVRRALIDLGAFDGLQSPIQIDRFGDVRRNHFVMTIRDGKFVRVGVAGEGR